MKTVLTTMIFFVTCAATWSSPLARLKAAEGLEIKTEVQQVGSRNQCIVVNLVNKTTHDLLLPEDDINSPWAYFRLYLTKNGSPVKTGDIASEDLYSSILNKTIHPGTTVLVDKMAPNANGNTCIALSRWGVAPFTSGSYKLRLSSRFYYDPAALDSIDEERGLRSKIETISVP